MHLLARALHASMRLILMAEMETAALPSVTVLPLLLLLATVLQECIFAD